MTPRRTEGGFTLNEVLVVVAIVAVLVGGVAFAMGGLVDDSRAAACHTEARTVRNALAAFHAHESRYPTAANATTSSGEQFIPSFLDGVPSLVSINYGADASTMPTYDWIGDCAALGDQPGGT